MIKFLLNNHNFIIKINNKLMILLFLSFLFEKILLINTLIITFYRIYDYIFHNFDKIIIKNLILI